MAKIKEVVKKANVNMVILPECFNSPYGTNFFAEYAEAIPDGFTSQELSRTAKELGIFLHGGSFPEKDQGRLYNTAVVWGPNGDLIAKHRKVHLFDMDIPGKVHFKESDVLTPGDSFTTFQINEHFKVGLGVCYDIRFDEMARIYRNKGCNFLIYPGAFDVYTGPMHWELLAKSRALDTQCYVATVSPARDLTTDYVAYGHSMLVDPWGRVVKSAKEGKETIIVDLGKLIDLVAGDFILKISPILRFRHGGAGSPTNPHRAPAET